MSIPPALSRQDRRRSPSRSDAWCLGPLIPIWRAIESSKEYWMPAPRTLMTGIAMGESPRWHDDRLWFCDWVAQEIIALDPVSDPAGRSEVMLRHVGAMPFCIDWLPDGRLVIVSGRDGLLLRREADGSLATQADLSEHGRSPWSELG